MRVMIPELLGGVAKPLDYEKTFLGAFFPLNPFALFFLCFSVGCTLCLIYERVRGCFRPQPSPATRDLALLLCAPVLAVLNAILYAIVGTQDYLEGGLDADFGLRYKLTGPAEFCVVAMFCFVLGVIACMLPSKAAADSAQGASRP